MHLTALWHPAGA